MPEFLTSFDHQIGGRRVKDGFGIFDTPLGGVIVFTRLMASFWVNRFTVTRQGLRGEEQFPAFPDTSLGMTVMSPCMGEF